MLKGLRPVGSVALAALRVIVLLIVSGAVSQAASGASGEIGYRLEPLEGGVAELQERFEPWQIDLLEMLNRRDRPHLARLDRIVVPEFWHDDPLVYSPFPFEYAWAADDRKALVVHQP